MHAMRQCSRSLLQRASAPLTRATCLSGRNPPAACAVVTAAGGAGDRVATGNAAGAQPPHSARSYASPLHGMVYNERLHEWLLNDPLDKDAVQYVRHTLHSNIVERVINICMQRSQLLRNHKAVNCGTSVALIFLRANLF